MLTDFYGKEIKVGSRVAFNYSGEVRLGEVVKIVPSVSKFPWHTRDDIHVASVSVNNPSGISRVRNRRSLIVLGEVPRVMASTVSKE